MSESLRRLAHDLRGPALTIQGFASELAMAVEELSRATGPGDRDELARRVAEIVETDLEPCVECIAGAATTLAERIDGLDVDAPPDASKAA